MLSATEIVDLNKLEEELEKKIPVLDILKRKIDAYKKMSGTYSNNNVFVHALELLHKCLLKPEKFFFDDSAGPDLPQKTIHLLQEMIDAKDDAKICRNKLIIYGKEFLESAGEDSHIDDRGPWDLIQHILVTTIGLNLYELDIAPLDDEIERLKQLEVVEDSKDKKAAFIASLEELRKTVITDLNDIVENQGLRWGPEDITRKEILASLPLLLVKETTDMLKRLRYENQYEAANENTLRAYGEKYQNACNQPIEIAPLFKAAATVALEGLGFIFGAAWGAVAGFFYGAGIFSPITAPIGLVVGAIGGSMLMRDVGKKFICKIAPRDSLWRYASSKPTKLEVSANKLAQTTSDIIGLTQRPGSFFYKAPPVKKHEAEPFLSISLNNVKLKTS